ncbi:MAG: SHOCT domain-containing protein [Phycisphaerae bacterium]
MRALWIVADLTPQGRTSLLTALAILMVIVVVGGAGILLIRRRLNAPDEPEAGVGFSLSELRAMRDRGELTAEEFETAKSRTIERVKANLAAAEKRKLTGGFPVTPPDEQPPV